MGAVEAGPGFEPVDPSVVSSRAELASALTLLRERAGLAVRDLAREVDSPIATVGGYLSGRHLPNANQVAVFRRMLRACGVIDPAEEDRWWDAVARIRRATGQRPVGEPPPYRGLESFQTEDAAWFFGRESATETVLRALARPLGRAGRMVAVVGPSGSGKSSLVRAGVIPAIRRGGTGSPAVEQLGVVRTVVITPGAHPMAALSAAWLAREPLCQPASRPERAAETRGQALRGRPGSSLTQDRVPTTDAPAGGKSLLVVDQFEEVFASCPDDVERRAFISALCAIAGVGDPIETQRNGTDPDCSTVVIVLRADFYGTAIRESELVPVLADAQVVLGPMTPAELRCAVTEPARLAGTVVDDDLVDLLVRDLTPHGCQPGVYDAGALPLLSHAMSVTWLRARRKRLTVADYLATGGIAGAVAQTAEAVMASLTPAAQQLTRRVFLRLVNVDDEAIVTRRAALITDLPTDEIVPTERQAGQATGSTLEVLDQFVSARLITMDATTAQISHEALLTAWPRLQDWIDQGRAELRLHRQLADAAQIWQENHRDPSALLHGTRLATVQEWLSSGDARSDLTSSQTEFLRASEDAFQQEKASSRHRRRRGRQLLATLCVLAVLASGLAVFGIESRHAAATEQQTAAAYRNLALSGEVLGAANRIRATDSDLAEQLSMVAYRVSPTAEARSALLNATAMPMVTRILGPAGPTMQALAPDGMTLAVGNAGDGSIRLFSVRDPANPVLLGTAVPRTADVQQFVVTFSPDGQTLAAGSSGGTVELWDVSNPSSPVPLGDPLHQFPSGVFGLVFTPDGADLLAGGAGGVVARWSMEDPARPAALPGLPTVDLVQTMSITADGTLLAVGGRGAAISLWTMTGAQGPQHVADVTAASATVVSSAFSPDGKLMAVGARDGAISVFSTVDPAHPQPVDAALTPFPNLVNVIAFSGTGGTLAAGGSDGSVRLWDTASWKETAQRGHPGPVTGLSLSPDGNHLMTSAADGTTRLSSLAGPSFTLSDTVFSLDWKPNSAQLVVAPGPAANEVSTWDVSDRDRPARAGPGAVPAAPGDKYGGGVAVSTDGSTMASTLTDGRLQLWDVDDPAHPARLGAPLAGPTDIIQQVAFSADGRHLAAAANDASVWIWDVSDPSNAVLDSSLTGLGGPMYSVAFSPDGQVLAASSTDGTAHIWSMADAANPVPLSTIAAFQGYAFTVAISPDGRYLAVGGADRKVGRWDITDPAHPREIGSALTGPTNDIYWLDFSPDGRTLAAASTDRNVWLWDVSTPESPRAWATLNASTGQLFTAVFSPDGRSIAAGGTDDQVHQWLTDPAAAQELICATVGEQLTEAEWQVYLPGEPYQPPCG